MRIVGKFVFPITTIVSIACGVCQAQSVMTHHVRRQRKTVVRDLSGRLPASQTMNLVLTLPLRNQDRAGSVSAGCLRSHQPVVPAFLTVEEFTEQFGPTPGRTMTRWSISRKRTA